MSALPPPVLQQPNQLPELHRCASCGSRSRRIVDEHSNPAINECILMLCSRCQTARYCSKACQRSHWREHKRSCQTPASSFVPLVAANITTAESVFSGSSTSAAPSTATSSEDSSASPLVLLAAAAISNSTPSFKVQHVPGKGNHGIIAIRDFEAGDVVLEEKALFYIEMNGLTHEAIQAKVNSLQKEDQEKFYELWSWRMKDSSTYEESILHTNVLPLGEDTTKGGLFLLAALFNHSCQFNACHYWSENKQREVIVASRSIKKGEEMCIQYNGATGEFGTREERQSVTDKAFGFQCKCDICELKGEDLKRSDLVRKTIVKLDQSIPAVIGGGQYLLGIEMVKKCLQLLEELAQKEKVVVFAKFSRYCYDAYQAAREEGDMNLMKYWMKRTYDYSFLVCGRDPQDKTAIRFRNMLDQLRRGEIPPPSGCVVM